MLDDFLTIRLVDLILPPGHRSGLDDEGKLLTFSRIHTDITMWASPRTPAGFADCKWPCLRFRLVLEPWAGDTLLDVATLVGCLAAPAFICRIAKLRSEIDRLAPSCFAAFWLSRTPVAGL